MRYTNDSRPFLLHLRSSSLLRRRRLLQRPSITVRIVKPMAILVDLLVGAFVFKDLIHRVSCLLPAKLNYLRRQKHALMCISREIIEFLFSSSKV